MKKGLPLKTDVKVGERFKGAVTGMRYVGEKGLLVDMNLTDHKHRLTVMFHRNAVTSVANHMVSGSKLKVKITKVRDNGHAPIVCFP
jgi:hypothetical protein